MNLGMLHLHQQLVPVEVLVYVTVNKQIMEQMNVGLWLIWLLTLHFGMLFQDVKQIQMTIVSVILQKDG